jgi:hypothetical protein
MSDPTDCDREERHARYARDGILTTRMLTDAVIYGVRHEHGDARYRGHRASFVAAGVDAVAMAWSCAGRVLFTLKPEDGSHSVTLITAEDENKPVMGVQSICATWEQAVALIDAATKALCGGVGFARDDKIGMGF